MNSEDGRDILIELRADMRHVRQGIDHLTASDAKQWDRLETHRAALEGHDKAIGFLSWGVRLLVGGTVSVVLGRLIWLAAH